jgi:hypothetical protein
VRRLILIGVVLVAVALLSQRLLERPPVEVPASELSDSTAVGLRSVTLLFASGAGDRLASEVRELPEEAELHERVAALVAALEQGPRQGGVRVLPPGTALLHAFLDETGLLTLDLSPPFRQGFRGGARAEELALASLVRTVAANVPEAKRIRLVCGGRAVASLAGHFPLDQPLDPDDWY